MCKVLVEAYILAEKILNLRVWKRHRGSAERVDDAPAHPGVGVHEADANLVTLACNRATYAFKDTCKPVATSSIK